jgi:hypothetical protein
VALLGGFERSRRERGAVDDAARSDVLTEVLADSVANLWVVVKLVHNLVR